MLVVNSYMMAALKFTLIITLLELMLFDFAYGSSSSCSDLLSLKPNLQNESSVAIKTPNLLLTPNASESSEIAPYMTLELIDDSPLTTIIERKWLYSTLFSESVKAFTLSYEGSEPPFRAEFPHEIAQLNSAQLRTLALSTYRELEQRLTQRFLPNEGGPEVLLLYEYSKSYMIEKIEEALKETAIRGRFLIYQNELDLIQKNGFFTKFRPLEEYFPLPTTVAAILPFFVDITQIVAGDADSIMFSLFALGGATLINAAVYNDGFGELRIKLNRLRLLRQIHINHQITGADNQQGHEADNTEFYDITDLEERFVQLNNSSETKKTTADFVLELQRVFADATRGFVTRYIKTVLSQQINDQGFLDDLKASLRDKKVLSTQELARLKGISNTAADLRSVAERTLALNEQVISQLTGLSDGDKESLRDSEVEELLLALTVQGESTQALRSALAFMENIITGTRRLEILETATLTNSMLNTTSTQYSEALASLVTNIQDLIDKAKASSIETNRN